MRYILTAAILAALALLCVSCSNAPGGLLVIKNVRVIVGDGTILPSASVVIKDGRIQTVSTQDVSAGGVQNRRGRPEVFQIGGV